LFVKEGKLTASWERQYDNVTSFQLEGSRIGVMAGGNLYVKEGSVTAGWINEYNGSTSFALKRSVTKVKSTQ